MKMRPYTIIGILFLLVGTAMLAGIWSPLATQATIIYNTPPEVIPLNPSGTLANPTSLVLNAPMYVWATIIEPEGITSATVTIKDHTSGTVLGTLNMNTWTGTNTWRSTTTFTPTVSGKTWEFIFSATNTAGQTTTVTAYGSTGIATQGDFYVNGQKATQTSTISVSNPTLDIKFVATANGDKIVNIHVCLDDYSADGTTTYPYLVDKMLTETVSNSEWTGTVTLPAEGKYILQGDVVEAGLSWRGMNMIADLGAMELNTNQIVGLLLDLVGVLFLAFDRKMIRI